MPMFKQRGSSSDLCDVVGLQRFHGAIKLVGSILVAESAGLMELRFNDAW